MAQPIAKWTIELVRSLPDDGNRYEIIDGELFVTPAPSWRHQDAVGSLYALLLSYAREHGLWHVLPAPADIEFDEWTMVEPDLFVVPLVGGRKPQRWQDAERLLLAVEVLSPTTKRRDRGVKRRLYQRQNVGEYWIVDVEARAIERWRPGDEHPEVLRETIEWRPDAAHSPLVIDLGKYFAGVVGE